MLAIFLLWKGHQRLPTLLLLKQLFLRQAQAVTESVSEGDITTLFGTLSPVRAVLK